MESNNIKNKNSNSRTRRNNKRAQAYRQSNKSQNRNNNQQSITPKLKNKSEDNSKKNLNKDIKINVKEKVEQSKISDETLKQTEKISHEKIIEQEQKFKEEQKRRIEEILKQQKSKEQKTKESQRNKKTELTNKETKKASNDKSLEMSQKITRSSKNTSLQNEKTNLSIEDFTPKKTTKNLKNLDLDNENFNTIKEIENINVNNGIVPENKLSSIGKAEEKDLIEKLDKINKLELTSKINKLTKEAITSLEEKNEKNLEKQPETPTEEENVQDKTIEDIDDSDLQKENKKTKKSSKKGTKFLIILLILSVGVFIYAIINIVKWQIDNNNIKDLTNQINDLAEVVEVPDSENVEIIDQTEEIPQSNPYWDYIKVPLINVDFNELKKVNNDTIGWIQVIGTNINYPFVHTSNNSYYLSHSFDKSNNSAGWVFMDYRNNVQEFSRNNIIYAHGRLDTTMFGSLKNILTSGWLNKQENYIVRLSTEYENTLWQVFSVYRIPTTSDYIQVNFSSDEEFSNFITMIKDRSAYDFNTSVQASDKILTLSTCYNQTDKVVLHAKLIKREVRAQ